MIRSTPLGSGVQTRANWAAQFQGRKSSTRFTAHGAAKPWVYTVELGRTGQPIHGAARSRQSVSPGKQIGSTAKRRARADAFCGEQIKNNKKTQKPKRAQAWARNGQEGATFEQSQFHRSCVSPKPRLASRVRSSQTLYPARIASIDLRLPSGDFGPVDGPPWKRHLPFE